MVLSREVPFVAVLTFLQSGNGMIIGIVFLIAIIMFCVFVMGDNEFSDAPPQETFGEVLEKIYYPAQYSPVKFEWHHYGPTFYVRLRLSLDDNPVATFQVDPSAYDVLHEGDPVSVSYKKGKKTGTLQILKVLGI